MYLSARILTYKGKRKNEKERTNERINQVD